MKVEEKLNIKDLMVGDWVIISDSNKEPCRIESIGNSDVDGLRAIPITPEILEKNGIYPVEADNMVVCKSMDKSIEVSFSKESIWTYIDVPACTISSIGIRYVHELQHALRLCKIDKEIIL